MTCPPSRQAYRSRGCTPCAREVSVVNVDGSDSSNSFTDTIRAQNNHLCVVFIHRWSRALLAAVNDSRTKSPPRIDVPLSDQPSPRRLNNEGLPSIWRHPIPRVLQRPPNGRRRNALVAVRPSSGTSSRFQLDPLRQRAPHTAGCVPAHLRQVEQPEPEQIEHGLDLPEAWRPIRGVAAQPLPSSAARCAGPCRSTASWSASVP